jgi:hypothetical protein
MSNPKCTTRRSSRYSPALLAIFTLAAVHPAIATIHTVTDFGDTGAAGQLRTLMNAAAAGDTIFVPAGTIVLTGAAAENANASGDLDVTKDLTIVGAGAELTVIDGGGVDRVFQVASGVTASISGMTLRNGSVDPDAPSDPSGGGVLNRGVLTLADVVVADNFAGGGGGIANFSGGDLTLVGSTVSGNRSTGVTANGGGISNFADMTIDSSTISGNEVFGLSSSTLGGGIITLGTMSITNTTISGNRASGNFGGGIYQTPFAISLRLVNVTIVDNETVLSGGGLATVGGTVEMGNTILSGNRVSRTIGNSPDCFGTVVSLGHNLIENNGCTLAGVTAGNQLGRSARLWDLEDNGGPTLTHEPRNASGAIDGGDDALCPAQDQRGEARPLDGDRNGTAVCDIGAFELRR